LRRKGEGRELQGRHFALSALGNPEGVKRCLVDPSIPSQKGVTTVDREHVKGAADKAKGAIKDTAGKVMGDKELQTEGKMDKAKGSAHNVAGDVKDAVRKANE
jgi:uncharacterized protein YjbJ (UPF0337 family)